jgi:hypothetical protein
MLKNGHGGYHKYTRDDQWTLSFSKKPRGSDRKMPKPSTEKTKKITLYGVTYKTSLMEETVRCHRARAIMIAEQRTHKEWATLQRDGYYAVRLECTMVFPG